MDLFNKARDILLYTRFWIIFVLFGIWMILIFHYISSYDTSFSVLSYPLSTNSISGEVGESFLQGKTITGRFTAEENNLGILAIHLAHVPVNSSVEDILMFRIKEAGSKTWYHTNTYRSILMYNFDYFPLGFPKISNSKGKTYEFEFTSLMGNKENSIVVSSGNPIFVSKYKDSRSAILSSKNALFTFLAKKVIITFKNLDTIFLFTVYALPLLAYLLAISYFKKYTFNPLAIYFRDFRFKRENIIKLTFVNFDVIIIIFILLDSLHLHLNNDAMYIVIFLLWIVIHSQYKEGSVYTYIITALLYCLCIIVSLTNNSTSVTDIAAWSIIFFAAGLFLYLKENRIYFTLAKNSK